MKALLGHSSIKVTQGDARSVESKLREAVALMSGSNVLEFQRREAAGCQKGLSRHPRATHIE